MARHIQGKDGKMAGSIGDGKGKVPTASDLRRTKGAATEQADTANLDDLYAQFHSRVDGNWTREEYEAAVTKATEAASAYYDTERLVMSDQEYDALVDKIAEYEQAHPNDLLNHGLTTQVAAGASAGGDVPHPRPMLSLDKVTNDPEAMKRFVEQVTRGGETVTVEPKMDGMAVRAVYENGRLVQIVTRGDGTAGEDVTGQFLNINGDPISGLPADVNDPDFTGEVRGEVYMTEEDFEASNAARIASGKPAFANPRNATAGSLRRADPTYAVRMSFAAYDVDVDNPPFDDHTLLMASLDRIGFRSAQSLMPGYDPTNPGNAGLHGATQVQRQIDALHGARGNLGFPIDGAVVSVSRRHRREEIGVGNRTPKWALAYKYPAVEATSVIRDIEISIGRTGRISMRARIDPVEVDGSTVTYASVHNPDWLTSEGVNVGSRVMVRKAGDIIPQISGGLSVPENENVPAWRAPDVCPQCGGYWDKTSVLWRCRNGCGKNEAISYALGRDVLDVDGGGSMFANAVTNAGLVSDVADLYNLTVPQVAELTGDDGRAIGVKNATKIVEGIQKAKQQPLNRHLTSLNIRHLGRTLGRRLANHFGSLEAIRNATVDDLAAVDGVGTEKAQVIYDGLRENADLLDRLVAAGVTTSAASAASSGADAPTASDLPLAGKTIVVSGSVPGFTRTTINERIEALGGKASGSVSRNVDLVVTSETTTSKAVKARELGITVMDPDEFAAMVAES